MKMGYINVNWDDFDENNTVILSQPEHLVKNGQKIG
jgi:hypothetical protein